MATLEECADRLDQLIDACGVRTLEFRSSIGTGKQHLAAAALLATVLEMAYDFVLFFRRRGSISPKVILRSLMEAYVDTLNIARDADYLNYLYVAQLERDSLAYRRSKEPQAADNRYFGEFLTHGVENEARAADIERERQELKAKGYDLLTIRQRFERAGELDRYASVYYLLCGDSHHGLKALERRHLFFEEDGRPGIRLFKPEGLATLLIEADTVAGIVAIAVAEVSRLLDGDVVEMDRVGQTLETFRRAMRELLAAAPEEAEEVEEPMTS